MRNKESWNLKSWGGVIVRPQSDSLFNPYVDHLNCDKVLYVNDKVLYVNDKVLYVNDKILYVNDKVLYVNDKVLYVNDKVLYVNDILTFRVVWLYVSFCHQIL
jgi:hypothetical protein